MSKEKHYSNERNVQILLALLKANNIKKIIASPGATNMAFVGSVQSDPYFEVYSAVDERSAAYMACGMAAESGEPVVLSCTGATASRNYLPGLTEAYYRKLPVLAVTSHQGYDRIGHLIPQNIDRRQIPNDTALINVTLPVVKDERDEHFVNVETNKAVLELKRNGGGPVHIDLCTTYDKEFSTQVLPPTRVIERYHAWDSLPEIPEGKIAIYVGSHPTFTKEQTDAIDRFCATYDAIVLCDHTSGYYGKYRLQPVLAQVQTNASNPLPVFDLMIHIGEVSSAENLHQQKAQEVWRVNEDGEIRDTFKKLAKVFQMPPHFFFSKYSKEVTNHHEFIDWAKSVSGEVYSNLPELPFSNVHVARVLSERLPKGSLFHLGVSNTRRCWNMFPLSEGVESACNVGCCGIDGCVSTLIGAALVNPKRICYVAVGDLTFFYDLNSLGNRHVGRNVRVLLVNNGLGTEFRMPTHPCRVFEEDANKYLAAEGHFGHKSPDLVRHYATDLGFEYLSASNPSELEKAIERFTTLSLTEKPMLLEVFTSQPNETAAILEMRDIAHDAQGQFKGALKNILGEKGINKVRKILKK